MTSEPLTFERVWEMFQVTDRKFQETDQKFQETDRKFQEQKEEANRQLQETWKQIKETDRIIGDLGNRFGELAEHLVAPSIMEKFNELGFFFSEKSLDKVIRDPLIPNASTEIDILLENGDIVIAIEVKAKPKVTDVKDHIKRLEILRERATKRKDARKYQGAIAGAIMSDSVRNHIAKNGFYPIEQTGDTVKINIPKNFKAREW